MPMVTPAARFGGAQLGGDVALIVKHHDERVIAVALEHGVGAERPVGGDPRRPRRGDRRADDVTLLVAEEAVLAGMRVEAGHGELGRGDAELAQGGIGGGDDRADPRPRDEVDRPAQADMQRRMDDARVVEAQHEEGIVRRHAGAARDERRIAVEGNPGRGDGALGVRRADNRIDMTGARRRDRRARRLDRGATMRGMDLAEDRRLGSDREQGDAVAVPTDLCSGVEGDEAGRETTQRGMRREHMWVADQHGAGDLAHARVERRLERDLRPDAGRVAQRDRDPRQAHPSPFCVILRVAMIACGRRMHTADAARSGGYPLRASSQASRASATGAICL